MRLERRGVRRTPLALLAFLLTAMSANLHAQDQPNILLVIMDDIGIEHLNFYGIGLEGFAVTTNLSTFAANSRVFLDAWSSPLCSPTRALIQTGRHAFRTGIGGLVDCDEVPGLDTNDPDLLAKALADEGNFGAGEEPYVSAAFGKWHLGTPAGTPAACEGLDTPIDAGFVLYDGWFQDQQEDEWDYFNYVRTTITDDEDCSGGLPNTEVEGYKTQDVTDWVIGWINGRDENEHWFVYLAQSAAHFNYHCPPEELYDNLDFQCDPADPPRTKYRAMIRAFDLDLGELLSEVNLADTLVIVVSDNGSPPGVAAEPVDDQRAKGTVFQGGVRVPLIIGGAGLDEDVIPEGEIVGVIDLYATILTAAGASLPLLCQEDDVDGCRDSRDLTPYFGDTDPDPAPRTTLYTEWFYPNFVPESGAGPALGQQAIRNSEWKYLQTTTGSQGLYKISVDPWEDNNMINSTDQEAATNLGLLQDALEVLLDDRTLLDLCTGLEPVGGPCTTGDDCCSKFCSGSTMQCVLPLPPNDPECATP